MRLLRENLLVQFSVASLVIMVVLAVVISIMISSRLEHNLGHLEDHGAAMMSGGMIDPSDHISIPSIAADVRNLRLVTLGVVAAGFIILYSGLVLIVARGSNTITRHQRALTKSNQDLKQIAEGLTASNVELQQFAYVASHDLQEPLRMVGSYCQLLERRYSASLDQDGRDFIRFAVEGAARMKVLINDLLTYSRVGTQKVDDQEVDCGEVFDDAIANLQTAIEESDAVVTHADLPRVRGDATQLTQVFQNLTGNALKYRGESAPRVHVGVERQNGTWTFSINDNGIGIEPQYAERVFGIFERLHANDEYAGTGIGLAVCKKIVERHGGTIWLESKVGEGSTFSFTIPA